MLASDVAAHEVERFVDADIAASFLGIARRTLLQKVRMGKIPGHPLDPGAKKKDWRFLLSELHSCMLICQTWPPGACKPRRVRCPGIREAVFAERNVRKV